MAVESDSYKNFYQLFCFCLSIITLSYALFPGPATTLIQPQLSSVWGLWCCINNMCNATDLRFRNKIAGYCTTATPCQNGMTILSRHNVQVWSRKQAHRQLVGNPCPQSSQLAAPLCTDPGLKSGTGTYQLFSIWRKKRKKKSTVGE